MNNDITTLSASELEMIKIAREKEALRIKELEVLQLQRNEKRITEFKRQNEIFINRTEAIKRFLQFLLIKKPAGYTLITVPVIELKELKEDYSKDSPIIFTQKIEYNNYYIQTPYQNIKIRSSDGLSAFIDGFYSKSYKVFNTIKNKIEEYVAKNASTANRKNWFDKAVNESKTYWSNRYPDADISYDTHYPKKYAKYSHGMVNDYDNPFPAVTIKFPNGIITKLYYHTDNTWFINNIELPKPKFSNDTIAEKRLDLLKEIKFNY